MSPIFYGVFFEDINYGGDGGLYAELVANRSFEYDENKMCWKALFGAEFEIEDDTPANVINTHYARLGGKGGIMNTGFCGEGFAVSGGSEFDFCCYARSQSDTALRIVISDRDGKDIYAQADFTVSDIGWRKYEFKIKTEGENANAYLSVILPEGGIVFLDFISLFPKTFRDRKNGMRADIAEMIAALRPGFMRFPGGCIVEGRSFENMYNWKDTIGPPEMRPTNMNRWQMKEYQHLGFDASDYFQSYGIGFYEYFQFCEDIGAKPVPVINCGMTCQWHEALLVDMDKLAPFVQDALDLIEFANGGEESEWGRKRVQMGHKEPFGLEYIGIGNEQWGEQYFERYEAFRRAIAEKYPDIKLIVSAGWKNCGPEFDLAYEHMNRDKGMAYAADEHFYKEPEWFLENTCRYDNYDRSLPKVLIGEYAAHTCADIAKRENNWLAAISEAAFLTGAERNADHVVMTCYAPLLARENHQQWQPDLIWFDNKGVYGTPSYYIQKLFSEYRCEYIAECGCDDPDLKVCAGIKGSKLILKIVNISSKSKRIAVSADGWAASEAAVIEMTGDLGAKNTMQEPMLVSFGKKRTVSLEKYSVFGNTAVIAEFERLPKK